MIPLSDIRAAASEHSRPGCDGRRASRLLRLVNDSATNLQSHFQQAGRLFSVTAGTAVLLSMALLAAEPPPAPPGSFPFEMQLDAGAITSLKSAKDPFHTEYIAPGGRLG